MSKWFGKADDISSDEESDSSDDQQKTTQPVAGKKGQKGAKKYYEDSDESEEDVRVVKSEQQKKMEVMTAILKDLRNHTNINDYSQIQNDFDKIASEIQKESAAIFPGANKSQLPNFILRALISIEDSINDLTAEQKKKLNKINLQSYNKLKQKFKKYLQTTGPADNIYEKQVEEYRKNPINSEEEKKAQAKKTADAKKGADTKKKPVKKQESEDEEESEEEDESEEEESEEEEEDESEEESSEEEEKDIGKIPREQMTPAQRRLKWVKKETKQAAKPTTQPKPKAPTAQPGPIQPQPSAEQQAQEQKKQVDDFQIDYSDVNNITKKLKDIHIDRLKGKSNPTHHVNLIYHILTFETDKKVKLETKVKVELLLQLLNSHIDQVKQEVEGYMRRETLLQCFQLIQELVDLIQSNQDFKKQILEYVNRDTKSEITDRSQIDFEERGFEIEKSILPSLVSFLERLDHEMLKAYQNVNPSTLEYLQRLRDENQFLFLCDKIMEYMLEFNDIEKQARIGIIKLDHIYYKHDSLYEKMKQSLSGSKDKLKAIYIVEKSQETIQELVNLINKANLNQKMKQKAVIFLIYHHSIHNRFKVAKEILQRSRISDLIHTYQDITNQILYNRAITQIGMAAFRIGLIEECHDILVDICQHSRLKEVLAQGISRIPDKPYELEKEEIRRQIPPHMHINLQLLDCTYMISAMLLEIPNIAENQYSVNKRIISRTFKKMIEQYDSKAFYLAPENYRDNIVFAAKQLNKSNWQKATEHIFGIKLIQKMHEFSQKSFQETLKSHFKEAALVAFLCRASKSYSSFSLDSLNKLFEIDKKQMTKILSKLILRNKLQAHLDLSQNLLIMDQESNEVNELQQLSLQYVSKMEVMVENNERMLDMMNNGQLYSYKERSVAEINQLNATKKNKNLMKFQGASTAQVGTTGFMIPAYQFNQGKPK